MERRPGRYARMWNGFVNSRGWVSLKAYHTAKTERNKEFGKTTRRRGLNGAKPTCQHQDGWLGESPHPQPARWPHVRLDLGVKKVAEASPSQKEWVTSKGWQGRQVVNLFSPGSMAYYCLSNMEAAQEGKRCCHPRMIERGRGLTIKVGTEVTPEKQEVASTVTRVKFGWTDLDGWDGRSSGLWAWVQELDSVTVQTWKHHYLSDVVSLWILNRSIYETRKRIIPPSRSWYLGTSALMHTLALSHSPSDIITGHQIFKKAPDSIEVGKPLFVGHIPLITWFLLP